MFAGCEVVDLVCSRLRSLPYCYIYRAKMQGLSLCYSRKVAKTELYNVQQEKEEMVRRRESERKRDLK